MCKKVLISKSGLRKINSNYILINQRLISEIIAKTIITGFNQKSNKSSRSDLIEQNFSFPSVTSAKKSHVLSAARKVDNGPWVGDEGQPDWGIPPCVCVCDGIFGQQSASLCWKIWNRLVNPAPVLAGRLRDADVDADAEVARQVDSAEFWLNSTNELRRWSVRKRLPPWFVYEVRKKGRVRQNE